jgi:hypothetical protein
MTTKRLSILFHLSFSDRQQKASRHPLCRVNSSVRPIYRLGSQSLWSAWNFPLSSKRKLGRLENAAAAPFFVIVKPPAVVELNFLFQSRVQFNSLCCFHVIRNPIKFETGSQAATMNRSDSSPNDVCATRCCYRSPSNKSPHHPNFLAKRDPAGPKTSTH